MGEAEGGKFMPNFKSRYLLEDIPFGLAVIKGIADLADMPTPRVDMVMITCLLRPPRQVLISFNYIVRFSLVDRYWLLVA